MKTKITTALFTVALLLIGFKSITNSTGPPARLTNAPGEFTCTNCHSPGPGSEVTSGSVWDGMSLSVTSGTLSTLNKGTTYTFNLTFSDPSHVKYGFELCVLPAGANSNTASLGTLIASTPSFTQLVSSGGRTYLEHTLSGTSAPSHTRTWQFQWQTPASYTGGATFYVVVNSTDNDGGNSFGDVIYAKTFATTVILPVTWLYTRATAENGEVSVNWATASEENNWKFELEKSLDGNEWITIGEVRGKGNSAVVNKYEMRAKCSESLAYYRIKQIDFNGKYSYSEVMTVKDMAHEEEPVVRFNPVQMEYVVQGNEIRSLDVMDMTGNLKYTAKTAVSSEQIIPSSLIPGIYLVRIDTEFHTYYKKLLIQ
jgi:hypothetical protein